MSLQIPNVAHAMGVALVSANPLSPVYQLTAAQGFNLVEGLDPLPAVLQRWTMTDPVDGDTAICFCASEALNASLFAIVGTPPTPMDELASLGLTVDPNQVITQCTSPAANAVRGTIWCGVYTVPGEVG